MAYQQQQQIPVSGSGSGHGGIHYMNSPFGDTTFTKVFVGGLAWETRSETMRRYFEQFGEILEAVVITDKNTGRSKGYGFVKFQDPESATRACVDPAPIIDGRRANCNLASLGKPRPAVPFTAHLRSPTAFPGLPPSRGAYIGGFGYQQPVTYGFQQGFMYSPYGYAAYRPEYTYSQGVYSAYGNQQFLHIYRMPNTVNSTVVPYSQFNPSVPGNHSYPTLPGFAVPGGHQIVQFGGTNVNGLPSTSGATIPAPFPAGRASASMIILPSVAAPPIPQQPHFVLPSQPPQFLPGGGSNQNDG